METRKPIENFINKLRKNKKILQEKKDVDANLKSAFVNLYDQSSLKTALKSEVVTAFKDFEFEIEDLEKISLLFDKINLVEFNISGQSFKKFCDAINHQEMFRVLEKHKEIQGSIAKEERKQKFNGALKEVKSKATEKPAVKTMWDQFKETKETKSIPTKETKSPQQKK